MLANAFQLNCNDKFNSIYDEQMIRAKELSKIFKGTAQATYNNWYKDGLIDRYKIGGGVYYKLSEIKALIENSREHRKGA